ncbi:Lrp/AsnC family transcriptional regulator [Sulfolobus acidocaldarius]|uniref:Transcriptional regulator n=3 Tax=Sulfolobus acidocaldarius TaxID=2285 RepID=Q4J796_SULAC|nr:Lrp/AsnC family transcriptional regulator [Sulfolobus acidocaldarius]AAY81336.1 transcriptional regulator [Sulfolobus acidocaldarius DSM 639]AGE74250.1 transcriptional regulator [Sulfolobus acidocaldarius Ron12/I]ALU29864.1 AsnC family transcriptional regulator [Sulfolobus acidocaldarius]ALU32604.1 AsnC family transcriptional regulator [Sulfolobus acidocaldarius]WCM35838.1 AsnC family transcriptional regulator [Sulfolobus acidocaldarius DSM 639]
MAKKWEDILSKYLDEKDIKILKILNNNANTSDAKIAREIGLSKTTIRMRRLRLENKKILKVIGVVVLQNLGVPYADVLVKLKNVKELRQTYIKSLLSNELIYEISEYVGEWDLLVRVFHSDPVQLKEEILTIINHDAVMDYKINFAIRSHKAWGATILE